MGRRQENFVDDLRPAERDRLPARQFPRAPPIHAGAHAARLAHGAGGARSSRIAVL
jgi:hypothetical protein